jgi:hypothetical protein
MDGLMSWLTDMYRWLRGDEPPVAQPPTTEPPKADLTPAPKKRPKNKTAKRKKR